MQESIPRVVGGEWLCFAFNKGAHQVGSGPSSAEQVKSGVALIVPSVDIGAEIQQIGTSFPTFDLLITMVRSKIDRPS